MTSGIIIIMRARCNDVNDRPQGIPPPPPTVDNNNDDNGRGWAGLGLTNRPPGKTINIDTICRGPWWIKWRIQKLVHKNLAD